MEDTTQVRGHQCSQCVLVEDEDRIAEENLARLMNLPNIQAHAYIKKILGLIAQIVLAAIAVALLLNGSIRQGMGMFSLALIFRFALRFLVKAEDTIIELGIYTLPGLPGHMMWYGFICTDCGKTSWDHIHGYARLICRSCRTNLYVTSKRFYTNDGRQAPSFWRELAATIRYFSALVRFWWKTRKTPAGINRT